MMGELVVQRAVPSDLPLLAAIDQATEHGGGDRRALLVAAVERGDAYVALAIGQAVGFLVMGDRFFGRPFVSLLVVHPSHRRTGVGKALLARMLELHPGQQVFTSTNLSNSPARALFRRCGFRPCGILSELDPGDPELIFVRSA